MLEIMINKPPVIMVNAVDGKTRDVVKEAIARTIIKPPSSNLI